MKPATNKITVKFTESDLELAAPYLDHKNCLLATALKRMGYYEVGVGGNGYCLIDGKPYSPSKTTPFSRRLVEKINGGYKKAIIGKEIILEG